MDRKLLLILLLISFLFSACTQKEKSVVTYYPIDSLVMAQVRFLSSSKASLTKHAEINGQEETNSFVPRDTIAWQNELEIFDALKSINKSINQGNYEVEDGVKDSNSNLTVQSFTSNVSLPVVYLKIFYLDTPSKVKRIEALYREKSSLLEGTRHLIMEFHEVYDKTVLTAYSIEGSQKILLSNSVQFLVKGSITIP